MLRERAKEAIEAAPAVAPAPVPALLGAYERSLCHGVKVFVRRKRRARG